MFNEINKTLALIIFSFVLNADAQAAAPAWKIVPEKSELSFVATENNVPVKGNFATFTGDIKFDPQQLDTSSVDITISMGSVQSANKDVASQLVGTDWFDSKRFPQATFKSKKIINTDGNAYEAHGDLTIRDKTVPVVLNFMLRDYAKERAVVTGRTNIKRTAFDVGTGEWAKTDNIKDEVLVNFTVSAVPAK